MFRYISALLLAASPALACDDAPFSLEMREAIYARDIDRVESLARDHQDLFEAGERTAEDTRCVFRHFTRLRPETLDFVDDWLVARPDSPFAQTAKAWGNYVVSWQVRGEKSAAKTYPQAMAEFSQLQRAAWTHAEAAYRTRPRLIAASDALIKLANPNGQAERRRVVLSEVMAVDPNEGTVTRAAAHAGASGWGGGWEQAAEICDTYAGQVPGAAPDAAVACKLPLARSFRPQWDWMMKTLETGDYPQFDYLRLDFVLNWDASREAAELAHRIMSDESYEMDDHLEVYDSLAFKYGLPFMTEVVSQRRYDTAQAIAEHGPFNISALDILEQGVFYSERGDDGQLHVRRRISPAPEEALDYARRRVSASPYNADAWSNLSMRMHAARAYRTLDMAEPYRVNAIVYSNHSTQKLMEYIGEKIFEYDALQRMAGGSLPPEMASMLDGIDEDRDVVCPMLRAVRLKDAACAAVQDAMCQPNPYYDAIIAQMEDSAKTRKVCVKERSLPVAALQFTPMPVPGMVN